MKNNELLKYAKELKMLFKRKGTLWRKNVEIEKLKKEVLTCQVCSRQFKNKTALFNHIRVHRGKLAGDKFK
jgi:uncharacterized protein (DUF2225 family)